MGILAGAIGGFGTGLGRGLEQLQSGVQAYGLQQADRAFQMERLAEQNRFQAEQGDLTRAQTLALTKESNQQAVKLNELSMANANANTGMQITSSEAMAGIARDQAVKIAELGRESATTNVHAQIEAQKIIAAGVAKGVADHNILLGESYKNAAKATQVALVNAGMKESSLERSRYEKLLSDNGDPDGRLKAAIDRETTNFNNFASAAQKLLGNDEIKMPGATPPPQAKISLLGEPSGKQDVGRNGVLKPGGVSVEQPAAAAVVPAEPVTVPPLERMAMPRGGRVSPEKIAEVNTHNLNVEVQNLSADVNNRHRSRAARKHDMTQLETLSNDSRLSEAQRTKIMETLVMAESNMRTGT